MASQNTALAFALKRFKRFMNLKVRANVELNEVRFRLPGLSYRDCSRTGVPQPWCISKLMETSRLVILRHPEYAFMTEYHDKPYVTVISAQNLKITPAFYNLAALDLPMDLVTKSGHAGTSSCSLILHLVNVDNDEILVSSQRQLVMINKVTRKAMPLPDDFRQVFKASITTSLNVSVVPTPKDAFCSTTKVVHSDIDYLQHSNQSSYIHFCFDAAAEATANNQLMHFKGDMFGYKMDRMEILHQGETFVGDILDIFVWEDMNLPDTLYFQIMQGDTPVFYSKTVFFRDELKHKL